MRLYQYPARRLCPLESTISRLGLQPIDTILTEHFILSGEWRHVNTLSDRIVKKTLFKSVINPATLRYLKMFDNAHYAKLLNK